MHVHTGRGNVVLDHPQTETLVELENFLAALRYKLARDRLAPTHQTALDLAAFLVTRYESVAQYHALIRKMVHGI